MKNTTKNIESAKELLKNKGAINFQGTTENCNIVDAKDKNGYLVGYIYSSYSKEFQKIYRVKYFED